LLVFKDSMITLYPQHAPIAPILPSLLLSSLKTLVNGSIWVEIWAGNLEKYSVLFLLPLSVSEHA